MNRTPPVATVGYTSFSEPLVSHSSHSMTPIDTIEYETRFVCKHVVMAVLDGQTSVLSGVVKALHLMASNEACFLGRLS